MAKATISQAFKQFEAKKQNSLKEARSQEKMAQGNPLPIGFHGTGVISNCRAFESKAGDLICLVEATIVADAAYDGKTVAVAIRKIADGPNSTAEDAYAQFLDSLEDLGLARETRESGDMEAYFNELLSSPHYVSIQVLENKATRDNKEVKGYACAPPEGMSGHNPPQKTAVTSQTSKPEVDPATPQCLYLGKPHYIVEEHEDGTYNLQGVKNGLIRENVEKDEIQFVED